MSWNIQKPGDYINGPLTVTGAVTFQSTLQVNGGVIGQGALIGRDGASGGATYGSNTGNTNINSPGTVRFNVNSGTLAGQIDTSGNFGLGVVPTTIVGASGANGKGLQGDSWTICSRQGLDESYFANNAYTSAYNTWSNRLNSGSGVFVIAGGNHIWLRGAAQAPGVITLTESARLSANGSFVLGGGNVSANGVGIAFPAAQSASTDANTLDDYEEGTFTPAIVGTTTAGTGTYVTQTGRYTKVGDLVTIQIYLDWTAHTGTGNMNIGGLPFGFVNSAGVHSGAAFGYVNGIATTAGNVLTGYGAPGNSFITLNQNPTGGGASNPVPMDTAGAIIVTMTYKT